MAQGLNHLPRGDPMDQIIEIVEEINEVEVVELTADDLQMVSGGTGAGSLF
jgi:hypothetical protein